MLSCSLLGNPCPPLVNSNVIPDSKKWTHASYNLKYSLCGMTNFLGDFLSRWGTFKVGNYPPELLKPQCTWLLRATVDIKPAGPKHQCCQGQVLPRAGTPKGRHCSPVELILTQATPCPASNRRDWSARWWLILFLSHTGEASWGTII